MRGEKIQRRADIGYPFAHFDVIAHAAALAVAVHIKYERRYASTSEVFGKFEVMLFEVACAMAEHDRRDSASSLWQK
jgi:hypothetical protein